jgi:hypothetical protein
MTSEVYTGHIDRPAEAPVKFGNKNTTYGVFAYEDEIYLLYTGHDDDRPTGFVIRSEDPQSTTERRLLLNDMFEV